MLQLNLSNWIPTRTGGMENKLILPRLIWVRKDITMKELHFTVFKHLRHVFTEWADWSHPQTKRAPKQNGVDLRQLIGFPYKKDPEGA